MSERDQPPAEKVTLLHMQDKAFEEIPMLAERYVSQDHATAVYIQEALFALTVSQKADEDDLADRLALIQASEDTIILLPDEFTDLRLRATYHGAGLATEQDRNIPRAIKHRLRDNLSNYPPDMDYERHHFPWSYKFKSGALKSILLHDFRIAAEDSADGDLYRIANEQDDDDVELPHDFDLNNEENMQPGDFIEEAFLSFVPGTDAEEITYSAFLRAGLTPPFDEGWFLDVQRVVQSMIDDEAREG